MNNNADNAQTRQTTILNGQEIDLEDMRDFLWIVLETDHFGKDPADDLSAEEQQIVDSICQEWSVHVLLRIHRPMMGGDEIDLIGIIKTREPGEILVFDASDATGSCNLASEIDAAPIPDMIARHLTAGNWTLSQFGGTTITNVAPGLLTRADVRHILQTVADVAGDSWDDMDGDINTIDDFLRESYEEANSP